METYIHTYEYAKRRVREALAQGDVKEAERRCRLWERNMGYDRWKLFKAARTILEETQ